MGSESVLGDAGARAAAIDPRKNVVLEASAGTGKTRVLVDRYVGLLRAGVEPINILAITFTRKAASEMRQRIIDELRASADRSEDGRMRWRTLRDRLNEIAISTIDAFCLSLLREFPLEADLDPGFEVADETEVPRLVEEALDRTLRICRGLTAGHPDIRLVFSHLGEFKLRAGLAALLQRRLVAGSALHRFLTSGPRDLTVERACELAVGRLVAALQSFPGGVEGLLSAGPDHPGFRELARDLRSCVPHESGSGGAATSPVAVRHLMDRMSADFLTQAGEPRKLLPREYTESHYSSRAARKHHQDGVAAAAPLVRDALLAYRRDLNVVLSRGVYQTFAVATEQYDHALETHGVLDFSGLLSRATLLVGQMDEFARSRYRLESRYHHILVDEFQDTSRAQWNLVSQLIATWGEGLGLAHEGAIAPSIFVVGDRKQSIYGFRDAEVELFEAAAAAISELGNPAETRQSIAHSFRSVPALLAFANDLFSEVEKAPGRGDSFRYDSSDAFPNEEPAGAPPPDEVPIGIMAAPDPAACAEAVADEVSRLLTDTTVRDRATLALRPVRPADIAILFRSRESHRVFEERLQRRGVSTYVYKGLGFYDADEVKDIVALVRYLANPESDLRAAAFLRSRFVRISDVALHRLSPGVAASISGVGDGRLDVLDRDDRQVVDRLRASVRDWLALADTVPPSELLDRVVSDSAFEFELRGPRLAQAQENLKKIRALVRKIQNRGYLTFDRLSAYIDELAGGDESNAVVDAADAVSLMTVHASKGLEFPVVFVVDLSRGTGGARQAIRVAAHGADSEAVSIGDYESEADRDGKLRDREEDKRLLYVAVTRARDRLYLSATVEEGKFRSGHGGLSAVLPASVRALFEQAAGSPAEETIAWAARSGRRHRFRVCTPRPAGGEYPVAQPGIEPGGTIEAGAPAHDDFEPVADLESVPRPTAKSLAASVQSEVGPSARASAGGSVLVGELVHRLFERLGIREPGDSTSLERLARRLLDGLADPSTDAGGEGSSADPVSDNDDSIVGQAVELYSRMRAFPNVARVLTEGDCLFEVPISLRLGPGAWAALRALHPFSAPAAPSIVRGQIDCLGRMPDGSMVVIDFKTGAARPADRAQLDVYLLAARAIEPGCPVRGLLVYPDGIVEM